MNKVVLILATYVLYLPTILAQAPNLETLKSQLSASSQDRSCIKDLPIAKKIYAIDPNEISALKTIAECSQSENDASTYASETKEMFEQSKILSIVTKILEIAKVKDLVPILREVELKKDKGLTDYLMINEIYERLGEPEKQMTSLQEAIKLAPDDPRPIMILATKNFDENQRKRSEGLLKLYLERGAPHPGRVYLMAYVLAILYPLASSLLALACIWGLAYFMARRNIYVLKEWTELRFGLTGFIVVVPSILAFRFWQSRQALPLGSLFLIMVVQIFMILDPILSRAYVPALKFIGRIIYYIFNGTILAKKLATLSLGTRVLISILSISLLGTIAPTIASADLRYAIIILSSLILYGTIGSLMISFMRSRESLVTTLRWIAITATLPFLMSYVVANWNTLGVPFMYGELPTEKAIESLFSYLTFWGVSLFLATHLGKIMAEAFIKPIDEIMEKVALIEQGHFNAKVEVYSRDEIGHLGQAVNRMGDGLKKREIIEKTFSKYVDRRIAERILDGAETEVRVAGQTVNATVLFCDIRGFTTLSENSSPEEIVALLNQFFERMVHIVQDHGGVVDKFIGDNLMAVWGVPSHVPDAELMAVRASLAMLEEMDKWNKELIQQGRSSVGIGIGLNCGPVVAGSIGSMDRMEYTVIGDTVNTAQRAESTAKRQQLVITQAMYEKIGSHVEATALEPIAVKGKAGLQHWWSVTGEVKGLVKRPA